MSYSNNNMMKTLITLTCIFLALSAFGQSDSDQEEIQSACMGYLEGFYEGDTVKLKNSIRPSLYKTGYWKSKDTGKYESEGQMTYRQAIDYAKGVKEKKRFAKPDAPKYVEILDVSNHLASAKITAWWGIDYALLTKTDGKWMIEQVLWEGPLDK